MARILIVDDEASMREFLDIFLRKEGYQTETAPSAEDAFVKMEVSEYDLILTDLKMPKASGIDVLQRAKELWPETQVIVMTAYSTTETAVAAMAAQAGMKLCHGSEPTPGEQRRIDADQPGPFRKWQSPQPLFPNVPNARSATGRSVPAASPTSWKR